MKTKQTNYKQNLGRLLRNLRKSEEASQEEFADMLGINRTYYGNIERGENSISLDKLQKISKVLDTPLSDLFKKVEELK